MSRFARRRDIAERAIIMALRKNGCSVQQLDGAGVPDLLVGHRGEIWLLEVKDEHGKPGVGMRKTADGLRDSQREWFAKWQGAAPIVVTTVEEALKAVGL